MGDKMKKKVIIISVFVFILAVIAITFALPTFRINRINLLKDSKINELKKSLDSDYQIKEPEIVASDSEDLIIKSAYESISLLLGKPNTENKLDDYFSAETKFQKFLEYCYENNDLPTDNGTIHSDYKYYVIPEDETKEEQFEYSFKEIIDLKINFYEDLKIIDFYTFDGINYSILFRASNAQFKLKNSLSHVYEDTTGDIDIRVRLLKYNSVKILSFYVTYDTNKGEKVSDKGNSEVNSLIGKLSYNDIKEREYTDEEKVKIEEIYNKNKESIVALSTSNINNAITSNATGFFIREGVILTNWTWFENYLLSSDSLTVSDVNNKIYHIDGIISLSNVYDVVALKLTEEVGTPITTKGYVSGYNKDLVVALTSPTSIGVATNVGENLEKENNIYKMNLVINDGEVGAPVFNIKGELVGITNANQLNSTISFASDVYSFNSMLIALKFDKFEKIVSYNLMVLKNNMYTDLTGKLESTQEYDQNIYNKYMQDFDIKKAYGDNISNIITKNNKMTIKVSFSENNIISKKQYVNLYASKLKNAGYKVNGNNDYQMILEKDNIRINIKYESSYIVITYRGVGDE